MSAATAGTDTLTGTQRRALQRRLGRLGQGPTNEYLATIHTLDEMDGVTASRARAADIVRDRPDSDAAQAATLWLDCTVTA